MDPTATVSFKTMMENGVLATLAFSYIILGIAAVRVIPGIFTSIKNADKEMLTWTLAAQKESQTATSAMLEKMQANFNATIERVSQGFEKRHAEAIAGVAELKQWHRATADRILLDIQLIRSSLLSLGTAVNLRDSVHMLEEEVIPPANHHKSKGS